MYNIHLKYIKGSLGMKDEGAMGIECQDLLNVTPRTPKHLCKGSLSYLLLL